MGSATTRSQRKKLKEYLSQQQHDSQEFQIENGSLHEISSYIEEKPSYDNQLDLSKSTCIDKITMNLQKTEQALNEYKQSLNQNTNTNNNNTNNSSKFTFKTTSECSSTGNSKNDTRKLTQQITNNNIIRNSSREVGQYGSSLENMIGEFSNKLNQKEFVNNYRNIVDVSTNNNSSIEDIQTYTNANIRQQQQQKDHPNYFNFTNQTSSINNNQNINPTSSKIKLSLNIDDQQNNNLEYQAQQELHSCSNSESSESSSDEDEELNQRMNELQQTQNNKLRSGYGQYNNNDKSKDQSVNESMTSDLSLRKAQKTFDYQKYLQGENKENNQFKMNTMNIANHQNMVQNLKNIQNKPTDQSLNLINQSTNLDNSFKQAFDSKTSNSYAIAGAMRALQRKIKQLESENTTLKDCFQGIQKRCVDMEKSHQDEKLQTMQMLNKKFSQQEEESRQSNRTYERTQEIQAPLLMEIENLQQKVNVLSQNQISQSDIKNKYKAKNERAKQDIQSLKEQIDKQQKQFKSQKQEYQKERQIVISNNKDLETQNKELLKIIQDKDIEIAELRSQLIQVPSNNQKDNSQQEQKLIKYKKCIKELRRELKMLEKSHQVSQKALKHTEHFVDEIVHVNDRLVNSLTRNKQKLRSVSASTKRILPNQHYMTNQQQQSEGKFANNSMRDDIRQAYSQAHKNITMAAGSTPIIHTQLQPQMLQSNQKHHNDTINNRELLVYENENRSCDQSQNLQTITRGRMPQQLLSAQTSVQKPPRSTRNLQRCFSFQKTLQSNNRKSHRNLHYNQTQEMNPYDNESNNSQQLLPSLSMDHRLMSQQINQNYKPALNQQYQYLNQYQQQHQSCETSRFHDEEQMNNYSQVISIDQNRNIHQASVETFSNNKSQRRKMTGANAYLSSKEFTLQPYEDIINQVSNKINQIESDLKQKMNGNQSNNNSQNEHYINQKQEELLYLREQHQSIVKDIKKSVGRVGSLQML